MSQHYIPTKLKSSRISQIDHSVHSLAQGILEMVTVDCKLLVWLEFCDAMRGTRKFELFYLVRAEGWTYI
jgi:hypothetical protein